MNWCNEVMVRFVLPLEPIFLVAYLSQLFRKTGSPNTVSMAYAALVWLHDIVGVTSSNNPLRTGVRRNFTDSSLRFCRFLQIQ